MRVESPWPGTMRISRNVSIHHAAGEDLAVISATPGVVDEELTLEMVSGEETACLRTKVLESRPLIIDGSVHHQLRLLVLSVS